MQGYSHSQGLAESFFVAGTLIGAGDERSASTPRTKNSKQKSMPPSKDSKMRPTRWDSGALCRMCLHALGTDLKVWLATSRNFTLRMGKLLPSRNTNKYQHVCRELPLYSQRSVLQKEGKSMC